MDRLRELLVHFSKSTSIHGMQYIGNLKLSNLERIIWYLVVFTAAGFSFRFIGLNWSHYVRNPTVVTIKKDFRNWENSFPAATACYVDRVDEERAEQFIKKYQRKNSYVNAQSTLSETVENVSNLTYKTLHTLKAYENDSTLFNVDWFELVTKVHPDKTGVLITSDAKVKIDWKLIMTEQGMCFSLNSQFADLLSVNFTSLEEVKFPSGEDQSFKCHYLNGLCYARHDSDPNMALYYYVHSPLEVAHFTSEEPLLVKQSEEYEVNFNLIETYSSEDIRYLTPSQRKCRFFDEPLTQNVPVYGISICLMECRYRLALEKCGCVPFFYVFAKGKSCDLSGLLCLANYSHLFKQSARSIGCDCPQPCHLMVYLKQAPKITEWDNAYFDQRITFRWGLMPPTTKYFRKIIFGFKELIVSFGGVLSLCLGLSFISLIETIYLLLEYCWHLMLDKSHTN